MTAGIVPLSCFLSDYIHFCFVLNSRYALLTRPNAHSLLGYGGTGNEWEEYSRYLNPEGVEMPAVSISVFIFGFHDIWGLFVLGLLPCIGCIP